MNWIKRKLPLLRCANKLADGTIRRGGARALACLLFQASVAVSQRSVVFTSAGCVDIRYHQAYNCSTSGDTRSPFKAAPERSCSSARLAPSEAESTSNPICGFHVNRTRCATAIAWSDADEMSSDRWERALALGCGERQANVECASTGFFADAFRI
jgi:hypothetical protein